MSEIETVFLDLMDGFEFESFCARLFEKLDWGKVERIGMVADGGRDLIIHQSSGSMVVECKHQPKTSIGRPIVQKLHSAVISTGAIKGVIITTGKFTKEAIEHAKLLSKHTLIELIDFHRLSDLSQKAGIKIILDGENSTIFCFPVLEIPTIKEKFRNKLNKFQSYPADAFELMKLIPTNLTLTSKYLINADIDQNFSTSIGIIHSIHKHNLFLLFDGIDGIMVNHELANFLKNSTLIEFKKLPAIACPIQRQSFRVDKTTLKDLVKKQMISYFSQNISYYGGNNVLYYKDCKPGPRSIQINDTKQVLVPMYRLTFRCVNQDYPFNALVNNSEIRPLNLELDKCKICYENIHTTILLCNDCGNISHTPKFFSSESYICKNCKKTICKNCTFWWRKLLFFKKILCEDCANLKPKSKKKLVKNNSK